MNETMRIGLQEPENTPQVFSTSPKLFNGMSLDTLYNRDNSMSDSPVGCGYNSSERKRGNVPKHKVFVLGLDGKPLTPTTNTRARKLMEGKQAKPVWNKFSQFGIQMLVETRKETPKGILGIDFGTKFEGYSVVIGKENNLNVMWKLPNKKKLVKKLEERRRMRRARRWRNCRRRACRFDNRNKEGFIAPSQLQIVNSRLKCMNELMKSYPLDCVALEDVKFNHRDKKYGNNFSTIEIGKKIIDNFFINKGIKIDKFEGHETQDIRKKYGYHKIHSDKSKIDFRTHCSDSLAISTEIMNKGYIEPSNNLIYVDDSYRCIRRRLHDTQYSKGNIRYPFSSGNFKGIRKGTLCEYGQIVGGTKEQAWYQDFELQDNGRKIYQKGKMLSKILWLSHHFKSEVITG